MRKSIMAAGAILGIAVFANASPNYNGETLCSSSVGSNCFETIANANVDNISYWLKADGTARVDFRDKSKPLKNIYFNSDVQTAKAVLSILLTAKTAGQDVKIFITPNSGSDINSNSNDNYNMAVAVDP